MSLLVKSVRAAMQQLTSPTGNSYDEEWTIKLQAGLTYHIIELETNLKTADTIKKITIDVNGEPFVYVSGKMLDVLDKTYNRFTEAGRFVLDLSKNEYKSAAGVYQTQLATLPTDDVTLKIEFGSKSSVDPITPTLSGKAYVSNTDKFGRLFKPTRYSLTQSVAAEGTHEWTPSNTAPNKFYQRLVFEESECKINKIKIKRGALTLETLTRSDILFGLQRYRNAKPQNGFLVLDFTLFGFGANGAIPSVGLTFEFEVSGTGAIKTYVEGFDQVGTLPKAV